MCHIEFQSILISQAFFLKTFQIEVARNVCSEICFYMHKPEGKKGLLKVAMSALQDWESQWLAGSVGC